MISPRIEQTMPIEQREMDLREQRERDYEEVMQESRECEGYREGLMIWSRIEQTLPIEQREMDYEGGVMEVSRGRDRNRESLVISPPIEQREMDSEVRLMKESRGCEKNQEGLMISLPIEQKETDSEVKLMQKSRGCEGNREGLTISPRSTISPRIEQRETEATQANVSAGSRQLGSGEAFRGVDEVYCEREGVPGRDEVCCERECARGQDGVMACRLLGELEAEIVDVPEAKILEVLAVNVKIEPSTALLRIALHAKESRATLQCLEANTMADENVKGRNAVGTFVLKTLGHTICDKALGGVASAEKIADVLAMIRTNVFAANDHRGVPFGIYLFGCQYQNLNSDNESMVSFLNHSCYPNVGRADPLDGTNRLRLVALRDIHQGEELCIRYTPENRQYIESCYGFSCSCEKCSNDDERWSPFSCHLRYRDDGVSKKKSQCHGLLIIMSKTGDQPVDVVLRCNICMKTMKFDSLPKGKKQELLVAWAAAA